MAAHAPPRRRSPRRRLPPVFTPQDEHEALQLELGAPAQIEGKGKVRVALFGPRLDRARGVAHANEARQAPAFGLEGVDRKTVVAQAAGMGDVVLAAAERAVHPRV